MTDQAITGVAEKGLQPRAHRGQPAVDALVRVRGNNRIDVNVYAARRRRGRAGEDAAVSGNHEHHRRHHGRIRPPDQHKGYGCCSGSQITVVSFSGSLQTATEGISDSSFEMTACESPAVSVTAGDDASTS